jgi:hypothetical protein
LAFTFINPHFACIYLGIKALERERGDKPTFKEGLKEGVGDLFVTRSRRRCISCACCWFGTKWMAGEAMRPDIPMWRVGLQAFGGLVIVTMIFGLVYSTLISFFLAKRLSSDE